jgi:myo-inositol-1(or 4)-monophosphatase
MVATGDYDVGDDADYHNELMHALNRGLAAAVFRVRLFGSSAVNLAWVAAGKLDGAIMLGNHPWDMAAGVAIAREAGAVVVDGDNSPHSLTARATIATNRKLVAQLLGLVTAAHHAARGRKP